MTKLIKFLMLLALAVTVGFGSKPLSSPAWAGHGVGGVISRNNNMGRMVTSGLEIGLAGVGNLTGIEGIIEGSGSWSLQSTTVRSGNRAAKVVFSLGQSQGYLSIPFATSLGTTYFARVYVNFNTLPVNDMEVLGLGVTTDLVSVRVSHAGAVKLWNVGTNLQIGSSSPTTLTAGQWYRIEIACKVTGANSGTDYAEARVEGSSFASSTSLSLGTSALSSANIGHSTNAGTSPQTTTFFDDFALNNDQGTQQISWPGDGHIILLTPVSDSAIGGWVAGGGGTTNLWDAVNNTPPVGLSGASETNTSQIKNLISSSTDNYDANLKDYATAGLTSTAIITLVQAVIDQGENSVSADSGALLIVSNPSQAVEDSLTYSAGGAIGTWPLRWNGFWGTAQYAPIVVLSSQPVLRVGKRTATTREVDVDFMGIYVEYVSVSTTAHRLSLMGVGH